MSLLHRLRPANRPDLLRYYGCPLCITRALYYIIFDMSRAAASCAPNCTLKGEPARRITLIDGPGLWKEEVAVALPLGLAFLAISQ